MNNRGEGSFFLWIVGAAIALGLLMTAVPLLGNTVKGTNSVTSCDTSQGELCATECSDGYNRAYFRWGACSEGQVCCTPEPGTFHGSQGGVTLEDPPEEPKVWVTRGRTASVIGSNSEVPIVAAAGESQPFNLYVYLPEDNGDWIVQILLQNEDLELVIGRCIVTARNGGESLLTDCENSVQGTPSAKLKSPLMNELDRTAGSEDDQDKIFHNHARISAHSGVLKLEKQVHEQDKEKIISVPFDANVRDEFIGETLLFSIEAWPKEDEQERIGFSMYLKFEPSIRYGGLSSRWEQSKVIDFRCMDPAKCEQVFYSIGPDQVCKKPSQEVLANAKRLKDYGTVYCGTNGAMIDSETCKSSKDACEQVLDTRYRESKDFLNAMDAIVAAASNNQLASANDPLIQAFNLAIEETSLWECQPSIGTEYYFNEKAEDIGSKEPSELGAGKDIDKVMDIQFDEDITVYPKLKNTYYFVADEFDPLTQKGQFTLNQAFMSRQNLCVYGTSGQSEKIYSAGKAREIFIDTVPPEAQVDFRPLRLEVEFGCADASGASGCSDGYSYSYVDEVTKFLPALFSSGGQSAYKWCPPPGSLKYVKESRKTIPYTSNEVRVMCLQAEDKAGNKALAMQTVFNGYDLLAKAIVAVDQYDE